MEVVRRGYIPKDAIEFGPKATKKLNAAAQELVFLMERFVIWQACSPAWSEWSPRMPSFWTSAAVGTI